MEENVRGNGLTLIYSSHVAVFIFDISTPLESVDLIHTVQRRMLSKGAKRWIWDDITLFPKYFWQMTIARNEDINRNDISILKLFKKLLVSANTSVQFNRRNSNSEILYRSVCDDETFHNQT